MKHAHSIVGLASLWLLTACPADGPQGDGDGSSSSSGAASSSTGTDPGATSVLPGQDTGSADGTTTAEPPPGTSDGMDSVGFISVGDSTTDPGMPLPNGEMCQDDGECESGHCYVFDGPGGGGGMGGVCSECEQDTDCKMGTCDISFDVGFGYCTDGSAGVDCDSDEGCADGLVCAPLFEGDGFVPTRCSECRDDAPCPEGEGCVLVMGGGLFDAYLGCVEPGMVALGGGCPVVDGIGDGTYCASGQCAVITVFMGSVELGVCSECTSDDQCMMGQVCNDPTFMMGTITPGACG